MHLLTFMYPFLQICNVEFDRKDIPMNKLVVTTLEGKFHVFDTRTQNPKKGFAQVNIILQPSCMICIYETYLRSNLKLLFLLQVVENDKSNGTIWLCRHLPQNRDIFMTSSGTGHMILWQ